MKHVLIDQSLYLIEESDFKRIEQAEADCCGSCNAHTLQNLRNVLLDIITRYNWLDLAVTSIPREQFIPRQVNDIYTDIDLDNLPF